MRPSNFWCVLSRYGFNLLMSFTRRFSTLQFKNYDWKRRNISLALKAGFLYKNSCGLMAIIIVNQFLKIWILFTQQWPNVTKTKRQILVKDPIDSNFFKWKWGKARLIKHWKEYCIILYNISKGSVFLHQGGTNCGFRKQNTQAGKPSTCNSLQQWSSHRTPFTIRWLSKRKHFVTSYIWSPLLYNLFLQNIFTNTWTERLK